MLSIWENLRLTVGREFRHSLISYRRGPGGFALIVLLMTAGTGVVTLLFQLSDEILFRPLPVRDPSNLIQIVQNRPNLGALRIFPAEVYERLVVSASSVDQLIAQSEVPVSLRIGDHVERIYALGVSDNYYRALGIAPSLGRFPDPEDEQTTVLSHSLWSRVFDRDTSMIGRVITIDGRPFTVIGVTPRGFNGTTMDRGPDLRVQLKDVASVLSAQYGTPWVEVLGRLRLGYTLERSQQELAPLVSRIMRSELGAPLPGSQFLVRSISRGTSALRETYGSAFLMLLAGAGLFLIVVTSNLSTVLLLRTSARRRETAVRRALGGSQRRIFWTNLFDVLWPALVGTALGLVAAHFGASLIIRQIPGVHEAYIGFRPLSIDPSLNIRSVVFGVLAGMSMILTTGVGAALRGAAQPIVPGLGTGGAPRYQRGREAAGVLQVALTVVLMLVTGWLTLGVENIREIESGLDLEHVVSLSIDPGISHYSLDQASAFQRDAIEQVRTHAEVTAAGLAFMPILQGRGMAGAVVSGDEGSQYTASVNASINFVGHGYFEALGMHLIAGRTFNDGEISDSTITPAIVNETFADTFIRASNPIGWRFAMGRQFTEPMYEVVGVISDAKYRSLKEPMLPIFYVPRYESIDPPIPFVIHARIKGEPLHVLSELRRRVQSIDPTVPILYASSLSRDVELSLGTESFVVDMAMALAVLSIALCAVALYGIQAQFVFGDRRAIAIRLALGSPRARIIWLVCRRALAIATIGVLLGAVVAVSARHVVGTIVTDVDWTEPVNIGRTLFLVTLMLGAAAFIPTLRAMRIQPASALRQE